MLRDTQNVVDSQKKLKLCVACNSNSFETKSIEKSISPALLDPSIENPHAYQWWVKSSNLKSVPFAMVGTADL